MRNKTKKNIKDTIKDLIALVFIVGLIFGGYKLFQNYKSNQINGQDSYKIKTERDSKYNGYYSLTKLDEKGNNTWDGLMLHVENDKIVSCMKYDYTSADVIKAKIKELMGDKEYTLNDEEDYIWQAVADLGIDIEKLDMPKGSGIALDTDFRELIVTKKWSEFTAVGAFQCEDKVDFERVTDIKTDYDYMVSCGLVPAYDEESKEVWLSKLLSNKKSEYYEGYKLIKYDSLKDINGKYNSL